ncbi:hypothetical protein OS493_006549 [Desmophyllum pertusum]|uniref:Uncharacterized protein n=1 Tax=Desmophyllum pertusum TaxID=174260 RepID=A0A9X0A8K4_9CNID|nr:hypothetical protein OS493_006549 [Desmophyllum pertusum]
MVDLGGTFQIEVVIISNRYDCCEEKLTQIELSIGFSPNDAPSTRQVCYNNFTHTSKGRIQVSCNQWPYHQFGRYFFVSSLKDNWYLTFCELEVYPKIPRSLSHDVLKYSEQCASWRPSLWLAVERYQNFMYVNVSLASGGTEKMQMQPVDLYPDTPVQMGALAINDTVLAPFSWSSTNGSVYALGKVIGCRVGSCMKFNQNPQAQSNILTTLIFVTKMHANYRLNVL